MSFLTDILCAALGAAAGGQLIEAEQTRQTFSDLVNNQADTWRLALAAAVGALLIWKLAQ